MAYLNEVPFPLLLKLNDLGSLLPIQIQHFHISRVSQFPPSALGPQVQISDNQWSSPIISLPLPFFLPFPVILPLPLPDSRTSTAAAAAAKSLQPCPTLCDPIDGSPPGSPVPGILQARTLEWVATSFSNAWNWKVKGKSLSHVRLLATPWTAAHQAPLSMGFPGKSAGVGCHCFLPEQAQRHSIFTKEKNISLKETTCKAAKLSTLETTLYYQPNQFSSF